MENILSLSEAAKALPAFNGKRHHTASVWRWCRKGIVRNATRVTLRYVRVGRRIGIPEGALNEFFVALAAADSIEDSSPLERQAAKCQSPVTKGRTPKQRAEAIARARRNLAEAGI